MDAEPTRPAAQRRADRIAAFRAELDELERQGVLRLEPAAREAVDRHHDALLGELAQSHDVDLGEGEKQLSWGLRIASFLGALAFAASGVFFFYNFWGLLTTPVQVAILIGAPIAATAGVELAARREKSGYFAGLFAVVAFACFVLDLSVLGQIWNVIPTDTAFLVWGAFALVLAYGYRLRLLLAFGLLSLIAFLSARAGTVCGLYWLYFGERPENFLPAGVLFFALPLVLHHRRWADFPPIYRIFGLLTVLLPVLVLSNWGYVSYLPLDPDAVEVLYQVAGFALAAAAIAWGIRRGLKDVVSTGSTFFVVFLYTKLFDWWWDWMPKYLFFLVLGLVALGFMLVLKRLRRATVTRRGGSP